MDKQNTIWKLKKLGGLEVQKATYTHSFTPHFHRNAEELIFIALY